MIPSSFRLRSLASYSRLALCQRNPLPIQIPPTYSHSSHPKGDHSSQETGSRQNPCSHAPKLISSSSKLRSLALYPRLVLCQRNPLPIQIPPTYSHARHPTGDHSSQRNRFRQDQLPLHPSGSPRVLGSDHWHHTQGWPSAKGILSQLKSLPPTSTPNTLQRTTPARRQVPDKTHAHMHLS